MFAEGRKLCLIFYLFIYFQQLMCFSSYFISTLFPDRWRRLTRPSPVPRAGRTRARERGRVGARGVLRELHSVVANPVQGHRPSG